MKALKRLFKRLSHDRNGEKWECEFDVNNDPHTNQPMFNQEERKLLRAASLEYGSIPDYKSVTPEERDRWKAHLAVTRRPIRRRAVLLFEVNHVKFRKYRLCFRCGLATETDVFHFVVNGELCGPTRLRCGTWLT